MGCVKIKDPNQQISQIVVVSLRQKVSWRTHMYCMWFNDGYRQDVIDTHPTRCPQSGIKGQRVPVG